LIAALSLIDLVTSATGEVKLDAMSMNMSSSSRSPVKLSSFERLRGASTGPDLDETGLADLVETKAAVAEDKTTGGGGRILWSPKSEDSPMAAALAAAAAGGGS
jgi:hypothetical protein